jgi:hypothetical protein
MVLSSGHLAQRRFSFCLFPSPLQELSVSLLTVVPATLSDAYLCCSTASTTDSWVLASASLSRTVCCEYTTGKIRCRVYENTEASFESVDCSFPLRAGMTGFYSPRRNPSTKLRLKTCDPPVLTLSFGLTE